MSKKLTKYLALFMSVSIVVANVLLIPTAEAEDGVVQIDYAETETVMELQEEEMELGVVLKGSVSDTISYELKNSVLTISGNGEMPQYNDPNSVKWSVYASSIAEIIIEEGITSIGKNTFSNISGASVSIPFSMSRIDYKAFNSCSQLTVDVPNSSTKIETDAFYNCVDINLIQPTPEPTEIPVPDVLNFTNLSSSSSAHSAVVFGSCELIYGNSPAKEEYKIYCEYWSQKNPDQKLRTNGKLISEGSMEYSETLSALEPNTTYYYRFGDGINNWADPVLTFKTGIPSSDNTNGIVWVMDTANNTLHIDAIYSTYQYDSAESNPWHDFGYAGVIKKIVFSDEIIGDYTLGAYLFSDLENLEEVQFAGNLIGIGNHTFDGCTKLNNIVFPDSLRSIGNGAFNGCASLDKIEIPEKAEMITNAFSNCDALSEIRIPSLKGNVLTEYFANSSNIKKVEIFGDKEENLADAVFANAVNLEEVSVSNLKSIGESAFYGCSRLISFKISDGVTEIKARTFKGCSSLTSMSLPSSVTDIGESAFEDCINLETINIPNGIKYINNYTFRNCSKLSALVIPITVEEIGVEVLKGCNNLYSLRIPFIGKSHEALDTWAADNVFGYLFGYTTTPETGLTYQFRDENNVRYYYYIPDSLKTVEVDNKRLDTDNSLSDTTTVVPKYAFVNCASLKHITIDGGITVYEGAFKNCVSLKSLFLPTSVSRIEKDILYNCQNIESINVPFIGSSRNDNNQYTSTLGYFWGVADESKGLDTEQYYAQGQSKFYHIPTTLRDVIISNETDLPFGSFMNCLNLRTVVLGRTGMIDKYAFYNCQSLKDVTLSADLEEIGYESFANCKKLETINVPKSCTKLGSRVFYGDDALKRVYIPNTTKDFDNDVNGTKGGQDDEFKNNNSTNLSLELAAANNIMWYVVEGSEAEQAAKDNNIPYTYVDDAQFEVKFTTTTHLGDGVFSIVDNTMIGSNRNIGKIYVAVYDSLNRCLAAAITDADGTGTYSATITNKNAIDKMHHAYVYFWDDKMCPVLSVEYLDNVKLKKEDTEPAINNVDTNVIDEND
ncbi:MAG: leucine-rich repeat protein [Candidatus Ornithomonoglobus sp.]